MEKGNFDRISHPNAQEHRDNDNDPMTNDEIQVMRSSKSRTSTNVGQSQARKQLLRVQSFWFSAAETASTYLSEEESGSSDFSVQAPAFLGESCLWHEEEEEFRQKYTVICAGRSECVRLSCDGVLRIINDHPGVKKRFVAFRQAIVGNSRKQQELLSSTRMLDEFEMSNRRGSADSIECLTRFRTKKFENYDD